MDAPLVLELTIIIRKAHQATQVPNLRNLIPIFSIFIFYQELEN